MRDEFGRIGRFTALALAAALMPPLAAGCAFFPKPTSPGTYYLSPSGSNAGDGTSPATAWRTLARASTARLLPGSRLLLEGGKTFTGDLRLNREDAGNAWKPVVIGSYGRGRATITTSSGSGITVYDTAGVSIRDLAIIGHRAAAQDGSGIAVYSDLSNKHSLRGVTIAHVYITGFADGISIGAGNRTTSFRDVSVSQSVLYGNLAAGLATYGPPFESASPSYAIEDVNVSHVIAYGNRGNAQVTSYSTGNGIALGSVKHGSITWSAAYDNGDLGGSLPGPEGIWTYDSTSVLIAHDVSFNNRTNSGGHDGNGFGLDQNTSYCYMEYDLSFNNDGAGYMLFTRAGNPSHNTIRYSISSSNVQDGSRGYGGITLSGLETDAAVYQNTVVMQSGAQSAAIDVGDSVLGITLRNNIFVNKYGPIVKVPTGLEKASVLFQGNDYFSLESAPRIAWGRDYLSPRAWHAATGQETVMGRPAWLAADPHFAGAIFALPVTAGAGLDLGGRFVPMADSPVLGKGLDLVQLFRMDPGSTNFAGAATSVRYPNLGAQ